MTNKIQITCSSCNAILSSALIEWNETYGKQGIYYCICCIYQLHEVE